MPKKTKSFDKLIDSLEERVKELNCTFEVEELLNRNDLSLEATFEKLVEVIPSGWQYPDLCKIKIVYNDLQVTTANFRESPWSLSADINMQDRVVGWIRAYYIEEKPQSDVGPFAFEEKRLLDSIAKRLGHHIMYQKLKRVFNKWETAKQDISDRKPGEWGVVLDLLRRTDPDLFIRISRKMLNHLVWKGIREAEDLLQQFNPYVRNEQMEKVSDTNMPLQKKGFDNSVSVNHKIFEVAALYLDNHEILSRIQKWIQQDKTSFLVRAVSNNDTSLTEISDALRRYYHIAPEGMELAPSARIGVRASLIRRFFSEQLEFITIAKNFVMIRDFHDIIHRMVFPTGSHGKLGGKSAGVFLAYRILKSLENEHEILKNIKIPKTWYITSDALIHFMHYNNLEEILEQKYKDLEEVRKEYPHVVQLFKNSYFPPEIVQGLSMALDDFGNKPIVVRSSSLLEDRLGSAFSGKYKSLFIANQGSKEERLDALMDAIAEVYASTIGPDPIEYRAERGLLDFHEEMGIMIQEVVGQEVGPYFLPSYAGVAFSNNEFRWSPRIKREDGLIRLVPGLGTRAVDRLSDDYPMLIAPGQAGLRANVSIDETIRYSPQKADVVNLKSNRFESVDLKEIFRGYGNEYPAIEKVVSVLEHNHLKKPQVFRTDFTKEDLIVTFEGLVSDTHFVKEIHTILKVLQGTLATPVDIEFASDGKDFYLLQCRPQSYSSYNAPSAIPKNISHERILFSANRYISNGTVPDIKYIVYVIPERYNELKDLEELNAVGRAVSQLNKVLPRRQFILMGPGRWGSRGDIKLGVNVTYSDINNTAVLIEIARKQGNYVPDLSFGTHFFQDLVEASIRYLPLYPDDKKIIFNDEFLSTSPNALYEILPAYSFLGETIRVIDVPQVANGMVLRILMNADLDKAIGMLSPQITTPLSQEDITEYVQSGIDDHWRWRMHMAEKIAGQLDSKRFGVSGLYLLGSAGNTTAQAGSDIDLLVHFKGNKTQKRDFLIWLEGWSLCLDELNFLRTGFKAGGLLDIHFVNDNELRNTKILKEKFNIDVDGMKELILSTNQNE